MDRWRKGLSHTSGWRKRLPPAYALEGPYLGMEMTELEYPGFYTDELINILDKRIVDQIRPEKLEELESRFGSIKGEMDSLVVAASKEMLGNMLLSYCVFSSVTLDAFSYMSPDGPEEKFSFIGLSAARIVRLYDIFSSILCHHLSFAGYGRFEEVEDIQPLVLGSKEYGYSSFNRPACPIREAYAKVLTNVALHNILLHEVGHLACGHLGWLRAESDEPALVDGVAKSSSKTDQILQRQALELQADLYSLDAMLQFSLFSMEGLAQGHELGQTDAERIAYKLAFGDPLKCIRSLAYTIYVIFRSEQMGSWSAAGLNTASHPPPLLRLRLLLPNLIDFLQESSSAFSNKEALIDIVLLFIAEAEQDLCRAIGRAHDKAAFYEVLKSEQAETHLSALLVEMDRLQPELEPYRPPLS